MKIGILTYHCVPNFGAQLQATSTVGYLKRTGHEAVVLNWYPKDLEDMYSNRIPKEQVSIHNNYTKDNLPVTDICRSEKDLLDVIAQKNLDAIIVGSDALFKYVPECKRKHFSKRKLKFVDNVLSVEKLEGNPFFGGFASKLTKKIPIAAFSVSSQNCDYNSMTQLEISAMKDAMDNFSYISVRDVWTKSMVEAITDKKNIEITPDPVFSFNQNCYIHIPTKEDIIKKFDLQEKYILLSFSTWYSSAEYIKRIADEAEKNRFQTVAFPMPEKLFSAGIGKTIPLPLSPIDWYALIIHSSGYIGERMHPIVVCLHNTIPFYCFDEYGIVKKKFFGLSKKYIKDSSKTYHILHQAELDDWMYSYKEKNEKPTPKFILDRIATFNRESCYEFSVKQQERYEKGMDNILKHLHI